MPMGYRCNQSLTELKQYLTSAVIFEHHFKETEREVADKFLTYSVKRQPSVHCSGDYDRCFESRWSARNKKYIVRHCKINAQVQLF